MNKKIISLLYISFILALNSACSDETTLKPLDANATILAFGDSLTYGTGTSRDKAYPAVLEQLTNRKVINAGVPGEISANGLRRLPALVQQHRPELIIICHGANDILRKLDIEQTRRNLQKMIDIAIHNGSQVVLVGVPEFSLFLNTSPIYRELAAANRLPIADDILAEILSKNAFKADHVHPNSRGYRLLAENISALLINAGGLDELKTGK